jgi:WD40 repeat protein
MSINSKGTLVALGGATGGVRIISIALSDDGESGEMKVVAALEGHVPNPSSSSTSTTQPATNFQPIPSLPGASAPLNPNATQEMDEDQEAFSVESCAFVSLTKGGQEVVVTAATDGRVLVWEPQAGWKGREAAKVEGAVTGILPHPIPSSSTSTPQNSTHLLTFSTASRLIHTIDLRTSSPLGLYQGSRDVVHCLDVSRDGKWVVGGGDDGVVRGWMVDPGLASSTLPRPSVAGR